MQERWRSWSVVRAWTSCRRLQAQGAQEMQLAHALDMGPGLQMYTVPGNCTPLGRQTTEGSPSRTWKAGGGSFLLLPSRHALSSRRLWTFTHNTCEKPLEEVQGAATSSLFPPPLFQDTWPRVQLLCAERNLHASETWPLTKQNLQRLQRNARAMIRQTARHCHHQIQWATYAAWHWRSGPHSGEKTPLVWTRGTLQWCSQDSFWHTGWWKAWAWEAKNDMEAERDCRVWKLSARYTWRSGVRSAMRAASQLPGRGAYWCGCCPCTCTLITNSMMMMMRRRRRRRNERIKSRFPEFSSICWYMNIALQLCQYLPVYLLCRITFNHQQRVLKCHERYLGDRWCKSRTRGPWPTIRSPK